MAMNTVHLRTLIALIKLYHPFASTEEADALREQLAQVEQSLIGIEKRLAAQERKP